MIYCVAANINKRFGSEPDLRIEEEQQKSRCNNNNNKNYRKKYRAPQPPINDVSVFIFIIYYNING